MGKDTLHVTGGRRDRLSTLLAGRGAVSHGSEEPPQPLLPCGSATRRGQGGEGSGRSHLQEAPLLGVSCRLGTCSDFARTVGVNTRARPGPRDSVREPGLAAPIHRTQPLVPNTPGGCGPGAGTAHREPRDQGPAGAPWGAGRGRWAGTCGASLAPSWLEMPRGVSRPTEVASVGLWDSH